MPTVSVIIPNYNHAPYLTQRIESVLNQTYQNIEVIILDDCSTDNSKEIIEKYRNNPKISNIIYNEQNSGSTFKQWNKGVRMAKGDWIWIAESDDSANKHLIEKLLLPITKDNSIVLSYCQSNRMNTAGLITGDWHNHTKHLERDYEINFITDGISFIKNDLLDRNVIPNASAVIFKKKAFIKAGCTDEDILYNSDWLLWMKILVDGKISYNSEILNNFRYHNNSVIAKASSQYKTPFYRKYDILMMKRFLEFVNNLSLKELIFPTQKRLYKFNCQEFEFLSKKKYYKKSLYYLFKSLVYSPHKIKTLLIGVKFFKKY